MATQCAFPPPPNTLQIRLYDDGADQSRISDLAAVAVTELTAGRRVLVVLGDSDLPTAAMTIGRGWDDPNLTMVRAGDLLGLTAALYRTWTAATLPLTLIVDDWPGLDTGADGGHDDQVAAAWLSAVLSADVDVLADLTGLDEARYLRRTPEHRPDVTVVAGGRFRRRADGRRDLSDVMGGTAFLIRATSVTDLTVTGSDGDTIRATVRALKHRDGPAVDVDVERPYWPETRPWDPVA